MSAATGRLQPVDAQRSDWPALNGVDRLLPECSRPVDGSRHHGRHRWIGRDCGRDRGIFVSPWPSGSAPTSNVPINVVSLDLTAGDRDVTGTRNESAGRNIGAGHGIDTMIAVTFPIMERGERTTCAARDNVAATMMVCGGGGWLFSGGQRRRGRSARAGLGDAGIVKIVAGVEVVVCAGSVDSRIVVTSTPRTCGAGRSSGTERHLASLQGVLEELTESCGFRRDVRCSVVSAGMCCRI